MAHYFLYGAGGHGKVVASLCRLLNHAWTFEDDSWAGPLKPVPERCLHGFVTIGDNGDRKAVAERLGSNRFSSTLMHPTAFDGGNGVGPGTIIMAGAVIQSGTRIGRHCIINTNASVDHDCTLGDFVHIAPGAVLCGGVTVGEGTLIGANATILPGVKIGRWQVIKAGTVVKEDVPDGNLAAANA